MRVLGLIEEHGTAFAKARVAERDGYPLPEWNQPGQLVRVILRPHSAVSTATPSPGRTGGVTGGVPGRGKVAERRGRIVDYLEQTGGSKAHEIARDLKIAQRTVERDLGALRKASVVTFEGSPKTGDYRAAE